MIYAEKFDIIKPEENGYFHQIATPEKAICDKLYTISPGDSVKTMRALLFGEMRVDESDIRQANLEDIRRLATLYKATNLRYLMKLVEGEIK